MIFPNKISDQFGFKNGQEFVAKLLWYSWDAGTRSAFAQPGGVGLKVLQAAAFFFCPAAYSSRPKQLQFTLDFLFGFVVWISS